MILATCYSFRQAMRLRYLMNMASSDDLRMCLGCDVSTTFFARLMNHTFDKAR
jgi:hypothetical protein